MLLNTAYLGVRDTLYMVRQVKNSRSKLRRCWEIWRISDFEIRLKHVTWAMMPEVAQHSVSRISRYALNVWQVWWWHMLLNTAYLGFRDTLYMVHEVKNSSSTLRRWWEIWRISDSEIRFKSMTWVMITRVALHSVSRISRYALNVVAQHSVCRISRYALSVQQVWWLHMSLNIAYLGFRATPYMACQGQTSSSTLRRFWEIWRISDFEIRFKRITRVSMTQVAQHSVSQISRYAWNV